MWGGRIFDGPKSRAFVSPIRRRSRLTVWALLRRFHRTWKLPDLCVAPAVLKQFDTLREMCGRYVSPDEASIDRVSAISTQ